MRRNAYPIGVLPERGNGAVALDPEREDLDVVIERIEPWTYHPFETGGFQLHPLPPGGARPSVTFRGIASSSRAQILGLLLHGNARGRTVTFRVVVEATGGPQLAETSVTVAGGELASLALPFVTDGRQVNVRFETAVAEHAADAAFAWARALGIALVPDNA